MAKRLTHTDWHGLAKLALHGAGQVTALAEELHEAVVAPIHLRRRDANGRAQGISGLVYRTLRVSFWLTGAGLDLALKRRTAQAHLPEVDLEREARLARLNGVLGDHLADEGNPLAIPMRLRKEGRPVRLERAELAAAFPDANGRLLIMVHGLCMNELQWDRDGHNHGEALARDTGMTPLYIHYNSGRHISTNGREMAALFEELVAQWPQPVEEIVILGHSMGGLTTRSACHYAEQAGHHWRQKLSKIFFIGTPHHGSRWERLGAWSGTLLDVTPYSAPFGRIGRGRSAGITDLRYGSVLDEDWRDVDRFENGPDRRVHLPLPEGVACYAFAASLGAAPGDTKDVLVGDGLVSVRSGLGMHAQEGRTLDFPRAHQWLHYSTGHMDLLSLPDVYAQILAWMGEET